MASLRTVTAKFKAKGLTLPAPAPIRAMPRVVRELGAVQISEPVDLEPWKEFLARIDPSSPASMTRKDLRRFASEMWGYPELAHHAPALLAHCAAIARRTVDRRLAWAYWSRFRSSHGAMAQLGGFCASKGDWLGRPWTDFAAAMPFWDPERGPAALGKILVNSQERTRLLERTGLQPSDIQGGYVEASFSALLLELARRSAIPSPTDAIKEGNGVLTLGTTLGEGTAKANAGLLAYVLLKPWGSNDPPAEYSEQLIKLLVERFGDPRTAKRAWKTLADQLVRDHGLVDAERVLGVFYRWVTEKTVRLFFDLIARTTERPDQWKERRSFWESYLDHKYVERAWFALGLDARSLARQAQATHGLPFGRVGGNGAASSQSVLLMKMGRLTIAEWSDNGRARFWVDDKRAPEFDQQFYEGQGLRTMAGGDSFAAIAHQGRWYSKFANHIYEMTGIAYRGPKPSGLW